MATAGLALVGTGLAVRPYEANGRQAAYVLYADGVRDDTKAFQAMLDGKRVTYTDGLIARSNDLYGRPFLISDTLQLHSNNIVAGGTFRCNVVKYQPVFQAEAASNVFITDSHFMGLGSI